MTSPGTSEDSDRQEQPPGEPGEPGPAEPSDAAAAEEPAATSAPRPTAARKGPLRGTGRGVGMVDEGGGGANDLMRRVRDAANAARQAAEQHRPAAERAVHEAAERTRRAAEAARPEAERLARQARAAAEAARPHVERAAHEAAAYAREHEDELRNAATRAARLAAPASLRPALDAMGNELRRPPAPGQPPEDTSDRTDGPGAEENSPGGTGPHQPS